MSYELNTKLRKLESNLKEMLGFKPFYHRQMLGELLRWESRLVRFRLTNAPEPHTIYLERIDEDHANPQGLWQEMGEPEYLRRLDVERLKAASRVAKEPLTCAYQNRSILLDIDLPPHAVAAITIELVPHLSDRGDLL
jgi:Glycosyl hydrolases family 39